MVAWKYGIKLNKKHDSLNSEDSIDPKKYSFAQFKLPIGHTIYIVLVMMITIVSMIAGEQNSSSHIYGDKWVLDSSDIHQQLALPTCVA